MWIALDVASSELWAGGGRYTFKKSGEPDRTSDEMIRLYEDWIRQYPIVSIEDGLAEGDWAGWQQLTSGDRRQRAAGRRRCVRDESGDSQEGNRRRRRQRRCSSSCNQIGTVTETLDAVRMASRRAATRRSSRTARARPRTRRSPISRSARPPARSRPDRQAGPTAICKYNQLLRIEEELGAAAHVRRASGQGAGTGEALPHASDVVLLRHGESTWNQENRFTGWTDVDLSDRRPRGSAQRRDGC